MESSTPDQPEVQPAPQLEPIPQLPAEHSDLQLVQHVNELAAIVDRTRAMLFTVTSAHNDLVGKLGAVMPSITKALQGQGEALAAVAKHVGVEVEFAQGDEGEEE